MFAMSILVAIGHFSNSQFEEKSFDSMVNLLDFLQNEIILATQMKDGYIKQFEIPDKINNELYTISITSNDLILTYKGTDYYRIIPEITGTINIPNNVLKKIDGNLIMN